MNISERKQNTIEHLRGLADGTITPISTEEGLCFELEEVQYVSSLFVKHSAYLWDEFSGEKSFPVPHSKHLPVRAYFDTNDIWEGEYGASRKRLCLFLADVLEKMTDEEFEEYCL